MVEPGGHELDDVIVREAVVDVPALAPAGHEPGGPEGPELVGDGAHTHADLP